MASKEEAQRELLRRQAKAELERRKGAADQPSMLSDVAQSIGTGLRQGTESALGMAGDVGQTLGDLAGKGASYLGADEAGVQKLKDMAGYVGLGGPNIPKIVGDVTGQSEMYPTSTEELHKTTAPIIGENYEPQTTAGKYAKTGAEFLPAAAAGEGNIIRRLLTQAIIPGAASEAAGQYTEGTAAEPYARVIAALAAPVGLAGARRAVTPFPASAERLRLADTMAHEGVDLTAGQRTGSDKLRYMESEMGGSAGQRMVDRQGEQFTSAALRRAGIDAPRATPEVMDQAFTRIGDEFNNLEKTTQVPFDQKFQNELLDATAGYAENTGESARAPLIENIMNDAAGLARGGTLDGEALARLRTRITDGIRKGDSNTRGALMDMKEALDDAVERSLSPDMVERWGQARNQYRNMLVLEQAATGAGENAAAGIISPSALRNATVQKHGRRNYGRGNGDFADLARAGEGTIKPLPNSGTAGRLKAQFGGASLSGVIGALLGNAAAPGVGTIAGGVAGAALPALAGRAMLSGPGRALLGNQLAGAGDNPTMRAIIAALLAAQNSRTPVNGAPAVAP